VNNVFSKNLPLNLEFPFAHVVGRSVNQKQDGRFLVSDVLRVKDVAKMLNCSESLVRRADMKQRLGAFTIGKRGIRFHRRAVEAYMHQAAVNVPESGEQTPGRAQKRRKSKLTSVYDLW